MQIHHITILGQGNVAWHYNNILTEKGFLTKCLSARGVLPEDILASDLIIIAVKDDAIKDVCDKIFQAIGNKKLSSTLVVHTSGYSESTLLSNISINYGCLYPVQSLKKGIAVNFNNVPLCYWANTTWGNEILSSLAKKMSKTVYNLTDNQRKSIHLAAVFANNFTNHLLYISKTILEENNIDFHILFPIIEKTFQSAKSNNPFENQTGPAVRGDFEIINKHRQYLNSEQKKIYDVITEDIIRQHH